MASRVSGPAGRQALFALYSSLHMSNIKHILDNCFLKQIETLISSPEINWIQQNKGFTVIQNLKTFYIR